MDGTHRVLAPNSAAALRTIVRATFTAAAPGAPLMPADIPPQSVFRVRLSRRPLRRILLRAVPFRLGAVDGHVPESLLGEFP